MTEPNAPGEGLVVDNSQRSRFEMAVGGQVAFADYRRRDGRVLITRVETPVSLRGGGVAAQLMDGVVQRAREQGEKITPLCAYAQVYFERRPELADQIA